MPQTKTLLGSATRFESEKVCRTCIVYAPDNTEADSRPHSFRGRALGSDLAVPVALRIPRVQSDVPYTEQLLRSAEAEDPQ
jgi:hypothetical protein